MPAAPASDVYSLGLVLLEAVTGRRPFGSRTPHEALAARLVAPPEIPAELPAPWRELLARMTAVDPAERPDAAGLVSEFRSLPTASPSAAVSGGSSASVPDALTRTRVLPPGTDAARPGGKRRTVIVASLIAVVLALGGITAAVALNSSGSAADPALPALPQPLDQHVDDLWKEVGP